MNEELFKYYVELGHSLNYERVYYISARRISSAYSGFYYLHLLAELLRYLFGMLLQFYGQ